jgi:hypothetical protein
MKRDTKEELMLEVYNLLETQKIEYESKLKEMSDELSRLKNSQRGSERNSEDNYKEELQNNLYTNKFDKIKQMVNKETPLDESKAYLFVLNTKERIASHQELGANLVRFSHKRNDQEARDDSKNKEEDGVTYSDVAMMEIDKDVLRNGLKQISTNDWYNINRTLRVTEFDKSSVTYGEGRNAPPTNNVNPFNKDIRDQEYLSKL